MLIKILKSIFYKQARKQARSLKGDKAGKEKVINEAEEKMSRFARMKGKFSKLYQDLKLILRMLRAYVSGRYTKLPWTAVFRLLTAIIYFVFIIDFIPDFIPMIGFLDDMAIITWVLTSLSDEAQKFLEWEKAQSLESEVVGGGE